MNILITSLGNKTNLIKYFRRALFNEGGGRLLGADVNPIVNARHLVDDFILSPNISELGFSTWLIEQVELEKIHVIIPSRDEDLGVLVDLKVYLKERFNCRVLVPDRRVLDICSDKELFSNWCIENNFNVPKLLSIEQVNEQSFPVFIKPKIGSGSNGTLKVESSERWRSLSKDLSEKFLVQEFIQAPEYTIDLFVDQRKNIVSVVPRLRKATLNGESIHAQVILDELIIEKSKQLAECLGLEGHNTIQCFKRMNQVIFIEVNPRFGGGFSLGVEAGADTPRFLIREAKGLPALCGNVKNDMLILQDELEMLRIQKDIIFSATEPKTFCFDLDGTICSESCPYEDAQPMLFVVEKINALYDSGHTIIISTARGAASQTSWRELIEQQLTKWGVKYHRLITDKPYADYYIDNKAVDILEFF